MNGWEEEVSEGLRTEVEEGCIGRGEYDRGGSKRLREVDKDRNGGRV